jgi:uncharacterized protein YqhQ
VGSFALFLTGMAMFAMLVLGAILTIPILLALTSLHAPQWASDLVESILPVAFFLLFMRLAPLSGTHAAEHMVVHAIERGEELNPDVVRRMPRVHPRCGTNLAAASILFLGILFAPWPGDPTLQFIPAALVTLYSWKKLGAFLQFYITTRRPNERQLQSGLKAGNELLDGYARSRTVIPSIPRRIWMSGLVQVMLGSFAGTAVIAGIQYLLKVLWNVEPLIPVYF